MKVKKPMRIIRIPLYIFFVIICIKSLYAGTLFNLQNPIGVTTFAERSQRFFVGSAVASVGVAANSALAISGVGNEVFTGITPEKIMIEGKEQLNPLHGAKINLLAHTGRKTNNPEIQIDLLPAVTIADDPTHVYVVTSYDQGAEPSLALSSELYDTNSQPVSSINALKGSVQGVLFAAVSPQGGDFGDVGGGVSFGSLVATATTGHQILFSLPTPVDITSSVVAINSPLQSLTSPKLHVSSYNTNQNINVGTLFAAFDAVAGSTPGDGVRAVTSSENVIGEEYLKFMPIVPTSAIQEDSIVAAVGENSQISTHFISTLFPSVGAQYLIVVGGVGPVHAQPLHVYALPLVRKGLLADVNSSPTSVVNGIHMWPREFIKEASAPGDLYTSSSIPAQVGGGAAPGIITSLNVVGDSVVITVESSASMSGGIFYSQALFDKNLKIAGWTVWQRAVSTQGVPQAAFFDRVNSIFWYTTAFTALTQSVVRTAWEMNAHPLSKLLNENLPQDRGGIQGVTSMPKESALFNQSSGSRSSGALFTGFETVIMAQTGADSANVFAPVYTYNSVETVTDGTLNNLSAPADFIISSGGVLEKMGAIIASTVVSDGGQSWIVVGGNGGIAILALPDGTGISNGTIAQGFTGLSTELLWHTLGEYKNVRKLIAQNGQLYILTDTLLERVIVTPALINKSLPFSSTNLAMASTIPNKMYYFFSDVLVSEPLVLLATSSGLLRNGNGTSVATAVSQEAINWQVVSLPETTGCVTRLFAVTQTHNETDVYVSPPQIPGNLYVLAGNVSYDQARIYRYVVNYDILGVNDSTLQLFNDSYMESFSTFYINIGSYRNFWYTDGLLRSLSRSRYLKEPLYVQALPVGSRSDLRIRVSQNANIFSDKAANSVGQVQRLSDFGSWVIPGDYGLVIHS